ncbi:hypothetical protein [Cellulosimicrobium sp. NPDC055967]|uniref:hypothetical protein n=1 Tax=Cellulosimicrobium sp. NPDC055967 TaxID=3345670 RepID=UPI0035D81E50
MTWPIGYVVVVVVVGWCTFFAAVAPRRPHLMARASWVFGMVVNEVPFLAMYLLVASTALAAVEGDLGTTGGRVTAGAAVVVAAGLVVVAWRGVRSDRSVRRAWWRGSARTGGGAWTRRYGGTVPGPGSC